MEPEAKYTLVGTAVLILVALLAVSVVWLRGAGEGPTAREYKIYFERQSLEGIESRSYVTMRGMRVGSVTRLRFSSLRPGAIEVLITVDPETPVRESTRATIERNLLTGFSTVELRNLNEQSPLLTQPPPRERQPVIAEGESAGQEVPESLAQLARDADEVVQRVNETLSPENVAALNELLERLPKVAARYDALGSEATNSVREIGEAARTMRAEVDRLSQRANVGVSSGGEELRDTARALRSAADSVGAAADRLRDPQEVIFGPRKGDLGPGEGKK